MVIKIKWININKYRNRIPTNNWRKDDEIQKLCISNILVKIASDKTHQWMQISGLNYDKKQDIYIGLNYLPTKQLWFTRRVILQ